MTDDTAEWLAPMLEALPLDDPANFIEMMRQASMPAREAPDSPIRHILLEIVNEPGVVPMAIDWIRFGQLLRERLGWEHYPPLPPGCRP